MRALWRRGRDDTATAVKQHRVARAHSAAVAAEQSRSRSMMRWLQTRMGGDGALQLLGGYTLLRSPRRRQRLIHNMPTTNKRQL